MFADIFEELEQLSTIHIPEFEDGFIEPHRLDDPATEYEIELAEQALGLEFDDPLRELYLFTDGGFWFGHQWLSIAAVPSLSESWRLHNGDAAERCPTCQIPANEIVTVANSTGEGIIYQLTGPERGKLFFYDHYFDDHELVRPWFDSLAEYFDFHLRMAHAGHISSLDGGSMVVRSDDEAARTWMANNGHPALSHRY